MSRWIVEANINYIELQCKLFAGFYFPKHKFNQRLKYYIKQIWVYVIFEFILFIQHF